MIGNDIVDLQLAAKSPRWLTKRVWDKVFIQTEQDYIQQCADLNLAVWRLWSMKESAYKAYVRKFARTFLNPLRIECSIHSKSVGDVRIEGVRFISISEFNDSLVHTVSRIDGDIETRIECLVTNRTLHEEIRSECYDKVISAYSRKTKMDIDSLLIRKDELGIPNVYADGIKQDVTLSISHHGRYFAYAMVE